MRKIKLEPGEYVVENTVKMYGPIPYFTIRFILGPLIVVTLLFVCYLLPKVFSGVSTNASLRTIPVYRIFSKVMIPLVILAMLGLIYFFISTYTEKILLTNQAILRRNVFSITRINFSDITSVTTAYESFNFNQQARANSFTLGLLLGINWQVNITAANNRFMLNKNMSKKYARALKDKLDAICIESVTTF